MKKWSIGRWVVLSLALVVLGWLGLHLAGAVPYELGVSHEGVKTAAGKVPVVTLLREMEGVVIDYRVSPYVTVEDRTQFNIEYQGAWYVCTVSHPDDRLLMMSDEPVFAGMEGRFAVRQGDYTMYQRTGDFFTTLSSFDKEAKHERVMRELSTMMHAKVLGVAAVEYKSRWVEYAEKLDSRGRAKVIGWLTVVTGWWGRVRAGW